MKFFITAIGSGNTLNYPHQNGYKGVLALAEKTDRFGLYYVKNYDKNVDFTKNRLSQDKLFYSRFSGTEYKYHKWLKIETKETIYQIGSIIIKEMDEIKNKFPSVKFHIEISAGYKRIGHILTLISYIRSESISKLTFMDHNGQEIILPIIKTNLHKKEMEILRGFNKGTKKADWNGSINLNEYVLKYPIDKKYIYTVLKKCKSMGLMNEKNKLTDFGNLLIEFC